MNNEQAARLAGVQAATRYVTSVLGSPKDIFLLADEAAHYILTGRTSWLLDSEKVSEQAQEKQAPAQQPAEKSEDLRMATVLAFANRAHASKDRAEVEAIQREVEQAGVGDGTVSVQGRRVNLIEYLRDCWQRHPAAQPTGALNRVVPDQSGQDVAGKRDETRATDLGL